MPIRQNLFFFKHKMSLSFSYSQSSECFHNRTYFVIVCLLIKTNVLKWYTQLYNKCLSQSTRTMKVIMMNEAKNKKRITLPESESENV